MTRRPRRGVLRDVLVGVLLLAAVIAVAVLFAVALTQLPPDW